MKSDTLPVPEQSPSPCERPPLNPWLPVFVSGFVILAAMGYFVLAWKRPMPTLGENERRLPDGSVLRIEAVTWGTHHRFDFERTSARPWAFWGGRRSPISYDREQPDLRVWMTRHDAKSGRSLDFDWWAGSQAIDVWGEAVQQQDAVQSEFGNGSFDARGGIPPFGADRGKYDAWLVESSFHVFRTDHGRFKLEVTNTAGEIVATFELTHPLPEPVIQTWKAEELPATKRDGDLMVTLRRLSPYTNKLSINNGPMKKWWFYDPQTDIIENGQPSGQWSAELLELTDPLGNHWGWCQHFSAREPTWKVRLAVCRKPQATFPAAETWTIPAVLIPEKNVAKPLNDSYTLDGVTVSLLTIAGAGNTNYIINTPSLLAKNVNWNWKSSGWAFDSVTQEEFDSSGLSSSSKVEANWPHLVWEVTGLTPLHRVYVLAKDHQGREVPSARSGAGFGPYITTFFKPELDAKSLTFSIFIHKGREFEFFVKPPELTEDKPMP